MEIRGRATGFQRMIENFGMATTSLIAGYMYTLLGPANSLLLSGALGLLALRYLVWVYRSIHRQPTYPQIL